MHWMKTAAFAGALLITAPSALVIAQDDKPAEKNEDKAPASAKEVQAAIQKLGQGLGRNATPEQIAEVFAKAWVIAGGYVKSNPDATDIGDIHKWAAPRLAYGKNHEGFLVICESYTKKNPEAKDIADWNKYYLAGSLGNETRKDAAAKEIAKIEKDGVNDAAKALLAAEIRLIDAANRDDAEARKKVIDAIKTNSKLTGSEDVWVQRDVMRIVFSSSSAEIKDGETFPDWGDVMKARDLDGKEITLADFKGKVVLIDFWAVWCGPCIAEMPNVVKAYNNYKDKGFDVIGISLDRRDGEDGLRETIKGEGRVGTRTGVMPWRQIYDGGFWSSGLAKRYGVQSIPKTVLIDKEGKVAAQNLRGEALEKKLAELLGEGK
ncbi:MAG: TlpA family protein disulfide reductase [Planctomycetes bacterium]|nr:TlpA family protein disulfide reductase [Planctomycetota bacterium]MCW8135539.1 TlpA family protein disulfide reductase [Planctomycetota bacterium]